MSRAPALVLGGARNAVMLALHRLARQELVAHPAHGFYAIVPPEYRGLGCLPAAQCDHITEWRARVPWVEDFQVEQDLVSSRALVEIFSHAHIRKFDPATGEMIDDKRVNGELIDRRDRRPGHWRAEMVTLPLVAPVRELQAGDATYPVEHSLFATLLSEEERNSAGFG